MKTRMLFTSLFVLMLGACGGDGSSTPGNPNNPPSGGGGGDANIEGFSFLSANDGANGTELWFTDGTTEGTTLVKDINETPGASSNPNSPVKFKGAYYFQADDGVNGAEL